MSIPGDATARAAVEAFGPFPSPARLPSLHFKYRIVGDAFSQKNCYPASLTYSGGIVLSNIGVSTTRIRRSPRTKIQVQDTSGSPEKEKSSHQCCDYTSEGNILSPLTWAKFCVPKLCCQLAVKCSKRSHLLRCGFVGVLVHDARDTRDNVHHFGSNILSTIPARVRVRCEH